MLFNMNNQMEMMPNHQINSLQTHNCCSSYLYSNIHSLLDHSSIHQYTAQIDHDNFSLINSFSPKHISFTLHQDSTLLFNQQMSNSIDLTRFQSANLPYLSLVRGTSENYQYFEEEQRTQNHHLFHHTQPYQDQPLNQLTQNKEQEKQEICPSYLSQSNAQQDFKSNQNNHSQTQTNSPKDTDKDSFHQIGLKVTKNVTKNIGKLLFKFIWKNRKTLANELRIDPSRWELFMQTIEVWKRENNITRQYLISKWHAAGQDASLFRIISRHFFRKRCLPAIVNSHIRLKKVHYQRISRFSAAITNPSALHSIA